VIINVTITKYPYNQAIGIYNSTRQNMHFISWIWWSKYIRCPWSGKQLVMGKSTF